MALALTTYADWSAYMGGLDPAHQTRDEAILEGVESGVLRYLRPGIVQATEIEYYDGPDATELILRRRPVTAIDGVHVDAGGAYGFAPDAFPLESAWESGSAFAPQSLEESESNSGLLIALPGGGSLCHGHWPRGRGNVKIKYTAGYATIPPAIVLAVHQLAGLALGSIGRAGPVESEKIGRYSYTILSGEAAGASGADAVSARSLLKPYAAASDPW